VRDQAWQPNENLMTKVHKWAPQSQQISPHHPAGAHSASLWWWEKVKTISSEMAAKQPSPNLSRPRSRCSPRWVGRDKDPDGGEFCERENYYCCLFCAVPALYRPSRVQALLRDWLSVLFSQCASLIGRITPLQRLGCCGRTTLSHSFLVAKSNTKKREHSRAGSAE
jgi:hypothetical protein